MIRWLMMQPRWFTPVTWRLIGLALLVAIAVSARFVVASLISAQWTFAEKWPWAAVFVLSSCADARRSA